jgi:C4-dicarboxylate-specific signal transduction histidine kinase
MGRENSSMAGGAIAILASAAEAGEIARTLDEHQIRWALLEGAKLPQALQEGDLAAAVIGWEMLQVLDVGAIARLLEAQPPWANFPLILLVDRQGPFDLPDIMLQNSMLLERPLVPAFLLHCARTALRTHDRQLAMREQIQLNESAGKRLRGATETLDRRVRQRMHELGAANERLRRDADELRRLQAELIHVSRLSAMGTMASTLAHELNQPLMAVSSYISGSRRLLSDPEGYPEQAHEALLAAEAAALRAGQILRRLRDFVARGNASVRPEKLDTLIAEACELGFFDQHLLGLSHRVELDRSCDWIAADRIQVQQVLINLFRNAVQAMEGAARKEVMISSAPASGGMVEISVSDTGAGIASEVREALFSPFQSSKPDGMGIGLSISRTIVEAHGGKIWAEDRRGGAVFRFTLPCAEAPEERN